MKTYEDIMKEHGYKSGLWNDRFSKKIVFESYKEDKKRIKAEKKEIKKLKNK